MKKIGAYIHIPFCKQKCAYCDFISFARIEEMQQKYVQALIKEIKNWKQKNKEIQINTIYIGGGTPSYIDSKSITKILTEFNDIKTENCQTTIEVNPGTVNEEKLKDYKKAGINRLSIGLQETNNDLLKLIGRIHTYEQFLQTYNDARKLKFTNINVDLMIGLPDQTIQNIKQSLKKVINLNPEHISVYSLIVEEDTPLEQKITNGELLLPDEEVERNMYWYVKNTLELNGYNHYEISNFSKPNFHSIHNMNCWNQEEYIGFGISAHSYIDKIRFSNIIDMEKYIENIENNNYEKNIIIQEKQTKIDQEKEYMLLGLRRIEGISIQQFKNKFIDNPIMLFKFELDTLDKQGLITIDEDKIKLTNKGLDLANIVWEEFV